MDHLSTEQCADLAQGRLTGEAAKAAREHADSCATCGLHLQHARAAQTEDTATGELATATAGPLPPAELQLERGTPVGRYVVLDCVGQGGMGMVYAAFDPELDRRVALKLLKSATVSEEGRSRLMREAQAMARLAHPNVVAVYDAGVHQGRIYVAMELVTGITLREWLHGKPGWREVVRVFADAGRGLAAAHAAHLVHRDFKPANVLIGSDGRVRVTDFGLARAEGHVPPLNGPGPLTPALSPQGERETSHSLSDPITQVGSIVGTVGYMSPEQILSKPLDPRTDQFSFCVCLWEALYGRRPFTGETPALVTQQVLEGRLPEPPRGSGVPARLHALLLRGLKTDPSQRFASMEALLDELQRDPRAAVKKAAPWLVAGAVVLLGAAGFRLERTRAAQACGRYEAALAGVWDEPVKAKIRAAFEATKRPFALPAYDSAVRALDAHASAYLQGRTAACEATKLERRQSEEVLALREACFDRKLEELAAVTAVLSEADGPTVERSVTVAFGLSPLAACDDVPRLRASAGKESAEDAEVKALRETVLRGKALIDAGQYPKALELLEPALKAAKDSKRPALQAQAELLLGTLLQQTGKFPDALQRVQGAFGVALGAGFDEIAARAAIQAVTVSGVLERHAESRMWLDIAAAMIARLGGDVRLELEQLRAQGIVLAMSGRPAEAAKLHEQVLAAASKLYGDDSPLMWKTYFDLGTAYVGSRAWPKAVAALERALEIKEQSQGAEHPEVALVLSNLGTSYFFSGQAPKSRAAFERALDIRERLLGKESPRLVALLNNLGDTLAKGGELEPARAYLARAIALGDQALGPAHSYTVASRISLVETELIAGRLPEAESHIDAVLGVKPPPTYLAEALAVKAQVALRTGKVKEARTIAESGVAAGESLGKASPELIMPLTALGEALLAAKLEKEAVPPLERALVIAEETKAWPVQKADAQFPLARALLATGGDAQRALSLAAEAQAAWSTTPARARELKMLEAWKQAAH